MVEFEKFTVKTSLLVSRFFWKKRFIVNFKQIMKKRKCFEMRKWCGKLGGILLALCLIIGGLPYGASCESAEKTISNTEAEMPLIGSDILSYREYCDAFHPAPDGSAVSVDIGRYTASDEIQAKMQEFDGRIAVTTGDEGKITWTFTVTQSGLYDLQVDYYMPAGKGNAAERMFYLDGTVPYREAQNIRFNRCWVNLEKEKIYTSAGNEYRRTQGELFKWQQSLLYSQFGYIDDSLRFYLTEGEHALTIESLAEPMAIGALEFLVVPEAKSYARVKQEYESAGYKNASRSLTIQGEDAVRKSHSTLYAVEDRTSPANEPFDEKLILLNCIGGNSWKYRHQWIEWEFTVPESGLYTLTIRIKQDYVSGAEASRRIYIDGKIPFAEAESFTVPYKLNWQSVTLGDKDDPWKFYFTAGETHTIRLEAVIGPLADALTEVSETVQKLNKLYRHLKMLIGSFPDPLRDYNLETNIPDLFEVLGSCNDRLMAISNNLEQIMGGKGEQTAYIDRMTVQLTSLIKYPDTVPERLGDLSDNLNNLSSWLVSASEVPLIIDCITFSDEGAEVPPADAKWYKKLWSTFKSFLVSFVQDYYSIDGISEETEITEKISLWLGVGRDQSMIIKTLSDSGFTAKTGIGLDIRLVDMSILLQAVSSQNGPDLAMFMDHAQPINYGLRGALYDLAAFEDCDEVITRFNESALTPFRSGKALYALPEQQVFPMLFYRTDVLKELGVSVPDTWDDLQKLIPVLQEQNMEIGFPSPTVTVAGSQATNLNAVYAALLLQNGASVYDESGYCVLNKLTAVNNFIKWTEYYTKYNFPKTYSDINRFRTGEMPLLVSYYTFYNTLTLAAPEIQSLWAMAPMLGTAQKDGGINRSVACILTGCVIFKNAYNPDACWKFLKWWTGTETQVNYGREIEALQGTSARWPTANISAMQELGWSSSVSRQITEQWKHVVGIPEVAGGYYVGRSVDNAIKSVINSDEDARETILDQVDKINKEIRNKRQELGLE